MEWGHTYVSIRGNDGQGEEIPLTGSQGQDWPGITMQSGAQGLDMPPVELHADASPNLDGAIFRSARVAQREVMIPVFLYGIDRRTLLGLKRKLVSALNPKNGYCVLTFIEADSRPRYLYCRYKGGFEGDEGEDRAGFRWARYGLQFTAHDPWFYSDRVQVAEWKFGAGQPFLSAGGSFLPLHLERGLVSTTDLSVTNPGDVDAWPIWELRGPVRGFRFARAGSSFEILASGSDVVPAGRTLTVDTRPGYKSLKDDQGVNYWPLIGPNPALWPIPAGQSKISVEMIPGGGDASLRLTFQPRYETY
ncbi:phage tail domain-containing protein [Streptomyces sp. NPDC020379]|uniref:phage tail domain-containing protein n=1 Tax=Streptomyces sp. NPDC020379 TaxID=3365071 RepID=UPI0037B22F90